MARLARERRYFRLQFSILELLLLASLLGPILGWCGPIAVTKVWSWLSDEEPAAATNILVPPMPMATITVKPTPMIGPVTVDVEKGMQLDALERRGRHRNR